MRFSNSFYTFAGIVTAALAVPAAAQDVAGSDGPTAVQDDAPKADDIVTEEAAPADPAALGEAFDACVNWTSSFAFPQGAVIYMKGAEGGEGKATQPLSAVPGAIAAHAMAQPNLLADGTLNSAYVLGFSSDGADAYAIMAQKLPMCVVAVTGTDNYLGRRDALTADLTADIWEEVPPPTPAEEGNWKTMYRKQAPTAEQPGRVIEATFSGPDTPVEGGVQMSIKTLAGLEG